MEKLGTADAARTGTKRRAAKVRTFALVCLLFNFFSAIAFYAVFHDDTWTLVGVTGCGICVMWRASLRRT